VALLDSPVVARAELPAGPPLEQWVPERKGRPAQKLGPASEQPARKQAQRQPELEAQVWPEPVEERLPVRQALLVSPPLAALQERPAQEHGPERRLASSETVAQQLARRSAQPAVDGRL
jgi:hypothetical protein